MKAVMLRNSERQSYKRCRQQWDWSFNHRLKPIEASPALRFGDLVHRALAVYYKPGLKRGTLPHKTFERLYHEQAQEQADKGFNVYVDDKWEDSLPLGIAMLRGYVEEYGDRDTEYRVLSSEQVFRWPVKVRGKKVIVVGTFDGVWESIVNGSVFFKEFKTAAHISVDGIPMDEQAGVYWTYGPAYLHKHRLIRSDSDPTQILYTWLRKALPDERPKDELGRTLNKDGTISGRQPSPLFRREPVFRDLADKQIMQERIRLEAYEMSLVRSGELGVYKNPGPLFMPNCRGCGFREMCEVHETGGDWEAVRDSTMTTWEPYADHELSERS